jgi:hypothetical protein
MFYMPFSNPQCNVGACHRGMVRDWVADGGDGFHMWRVAANILNKQSLTADKGVGRGCKSSLEETNLAGFCEHGNEPLGSIKGR